MENQIVIKAKNNFLIKASLLICLILLTISICVLDQYNIDMYKIIAIISIPAGVICLFYSERIATTYSITVSPLGIEFSYLEGKFKESARFHFSQIDGIEVDEKNNAILIQTKHKFFVLRCQQLEEISTNQDMNAQMIYGEILKYYSADKFVDKRKIPFLSRNVFFWKK